MPSCIFCDGSGWVLKNTYMGDAQPKDDDQETFEDNVVAGITERVTTIKQMACHVCSDGGPGGSASPLEQDVVMPTEYIYPPAPVITASIFPTSIVKGNTVDVTISVANHCTSLKVDGVAAAIPSAVVTTAVFDEAGTIQILCEASGAGGEDAKFLPLTVTET